MSVLTAASTAGAFSAAAFLGTRLSAALCASVTPFEDGPRSGRPPTPALIAGAAAVGAVLGLHGASLLSLALAAFVCAALVASWYSDVLCGQIPDVFTLLPLGVVLATFAVLHDLRPLFAALFVVLPFAIAAILTKGLGIGWGDVKLVALGGAMLGLPASLLVFAAACMLAVVVAFATKRRREPIAFAPYLAGSIGAALVLPWAR